MQSIVLAVYETTFTCDLQLVADEWFSGGVVGVMVVALLSPGSIVMVWLTV